jgi:hypothetical protein
VKPALLDSDMLISLNQRGVRRPKKTPDLAISDALFRRAAGGTLFRHECRRTDLHELTDLLLNCHLPDEGVHCRGDLLVGLLRGRARFILCSLQRRTGKGLRDQVCISRARC